METQSGMLGTFISPVLRVRDRWVRDGRQNEGTKGKQGQGSTGKDETSALRLQQ